MRVLPSDNSHTFAQWLLDIGHGQIMPGGSTAASLSIPNNMHTHSENDLIGTVYNLLSPQQLLPVEGHKIYQLGQTKVEGQGFVVH
jgi:hypothetical protein